jgi:photosystem II stability/assembly factor-like uncharacterized protein
MGQQQTTMTVAAVEEKGGGALLRRMLLVLTIAVLMVAMMAVNTMPAFAASNIEKANSVGNTATFFNNPKAGLEPGQGGKLTADLGREGRVGGIANGK